MTVERVFDAINSLDFDAFEALRVDDCISEYPQSGEVIRGRKNHRAVLENYPGGFDKVTSNRATTG